eukprot:jgi/Astpho2/8074/Aster-03021
MSSCCQVYLDFGLCKNGYRQDRTLGESAICTDSQSLGRMVIGLYGKAVPQTVQNFITAVQQGLYNQTIISKVLPGEYIQMGQQGSLRMGQVDFSKTKTLQTNDEVLKSASFSLRHRRPGTVSLSLATCDDDPVFKQRNSYHPTEFQITTGPGPATSLDGENIVFGRVLEGLDTISEILQVKRFGPASSNDRVAAFNALAGLLRDKRAAQAKARWGRPLKSIVITSSGVMDA